MIHDYTNEMMYDWAEIPSVTTIADPSAHPAPFHTELKRKILKGSTKHVAAGNYLSLRGLWGLNRHDQWQRNRWVMVTGQSRVCICR